MMCCVITRYHEMIGCDLHTAQLAFPSPIPPPVPYTPHLAASMVRFPPWWMAEPMECPTVQTAAGEAMTKIFDIGMFIPHLGVNSPILLVFLWLLSCSQAHFGVASVQAKNNGGAGPIAVALGLVVNPMLDCNDALPLPKIAKVPFPLPLPTGILMAPNTVVAGLTLGDLVAGIVSMALDAAITAGISVALGAAVPENMMSQITGMAVGPLGEKVGSTILGWMVGSPSGFSFTSSPFSPIRTSGDAPLGSLLNSPVIQGAAEGLGGAIDGVANRFGLNDYFNDVSVIPTFPVASVVPASSVEGPLAGLQGPLDVATTVRNAESGPADAVWNWVFGTH